jgi:hypothetical protein
MRIQIPVVDLAQGDVIHGVHRDGTLWTSGWNFPLGRPIEIIDGLPHIFDPIVKKMSALLPSAYPPGVLFEVER